VRSGKRTTDGGACDRAPEPAPTRIRRLAAPGGDGIVFGQFGDAKAVVHRVAEGDERGGEGGDETVAIDHRRAAPGFLVVIASTPSAMARFASASRGSLVAARSAPPAEHVHL